MPRASRTVARRWPPSAVAPRVRDRGLLMDFRLDPQQRAWRDEVRAFLAEHVTPALREEMRRYHLDKPDGEVEKFRRKVGEKGWFGLNWPVEYGGLGLSAVYQHILVTECEDAGAAGPGLPVTCGTRTNIRSERW